jgi:hypothetical protein
MFCTIMSTLIVASPMALKMRAATPGLSGTPTRVSLAWFLSSETPRMTTPSMLRVSSFTMVPGLSLRLERTSNTTPNFLANSTERQLHDLGAEAGEFEHFVVGNLGELLRVRDDAGVGGVNAVDVRVDLAEVGLERGGERDGGEVGTAAAERGDLRLRRFALESGDDDDIAGVEQFVDLGSG